MSSNDRWMNKETALFLIDKSSYYSGFNSGLIDYNDLDKLLVQRLKREFYPEVKNKILELNSKHNFENFLELSDV